MKTVMLTGGAGFIGRHLVRKLLLMGDRVICVDGLIKMMYKNASSLNEYGQDSGLGALEGVGIMKFKAISLEKLDKATISNIRIWRNQPFVSDMMYTTHLITEEEHENYIKTISGDVNRGIYVSYLDDKPFGIFQYQIYPEGNYAMTGNYLISQEDQEKGYGVIQIYFQNEILFKHLQCNKIYGEVLEHNKRALITNKKMGGVLEGVLRQQRFYNGKYIDIYCFGLLKNEWDEKKTKLAPIVFEFVESDWKII